jgi:hypothetical protein
MAAAEALLGLPARRWVFQGIFRINPGRFRRIPGPACDHVPVGSAMQMARNLTETQPATAPSAH